MRRAILGPFSVEVPEARGERMRGLIGRSRLAAGHAMLFERTRSVHTFGMRFTILVAFLDRGFRVIDVRFVRPGRLATNRHALHVLELGPDEPVRVGEVLSPAGLAPSATPGARDGGRRPRSGRGSGR